MTPELPAALAVAGDGDLYIADGGRNQILDWTPAQGFRLVAGTGSVGLSGDGGPAARAQLDDPSSLALAADGALYFAQAGRYLAPSASSGGMLNTVIREISPAGVITTVAGLHPSCQSGPVRSVPAQAALFYGARLSLSDSGALSVDARICVDNLDAAGFGPNLLLTSSGRFVVDTVNPVPAVASVNCGSGVPGRGFRAFSCTSGRGHPNELLVVRSDGSFDAYRDTEAVDFAVGDSEVVATYDGDVVRVTASHLVTLVENRVLGGTKLVVDVSSPAVAPDGAIYFVTSATNRVGCESRLLERAPRGTLHQIWASSVSKHNVCF